jgi:lipoprotein-releasing system permease protein
LSFSQFIASRIYKPQKSSFSGTVYKIGVGITGLGVALLLIAFSIFNGFKENVNQKIESLYPETVFKKMETDTSAIEITKVFWANAKGIETKNIQLTAQKTGILKSKSAINGAILYGLGNNYNHQKLEAIKIAGRNIQYNAKGSSNEIWISEKLANVLDLTLNQSLICYFLDPKPRARKLKIVGIFKTHFEQFDEQLILCDLHFLQTLNGWKPNQGTQIELHGHNKLSNDQLYKLKNSLGYLCTYQTLENEFSETLDWLKILDQNMLLFVIIISIVAAFNLVSVLLVLILEKIPTVGLLKAMGASAGQVNTIFYRIGFKIIFTGMFWGNLIGLGLCMLQSYTHWAPLNENNYYISYVPIKVDLGSIVYINIGCIILASMVLLLPRLSLRNIQLIKAINFGK